MPFLILIILAVAIWTGGALPAWSQNTDVGSKLNDVALDVNVVQVVLNDEHRQGVDWEAIVSDFHTVLLRKENNPVWADKKYKISVGTVSNEDYGVLIEALDTVGRMTQSVQPGLMLAEEVKQGRQVDFPSQSTGVDVGINAVLARSANNALKLRLELLLGKMIKEDGTSEAVRLKAQTEVLLQENTVIVLGGITSEERVTKTYKFPLLGDLPLIGLVFRSRGHLMQKTETVVFLTPRIKSVSDTEGNP